MIKGEKVDTGDLIVNKTKIGDPEINKIDDQIKEFKTLYQNSLDKNDVKSAKVYLQNLRNLQKTERELVEVKKQKNDQAIEQRKSNIETKDEQGIVPENTIQYKDKNRSELEIEAENMNERKQFLLKQLDIIDEDTLPDQIKEDNLKINQSDNLLKNKNKVKESLQSGINCTRRSL